MALAEASIVTHVNDGSGTWVNIPSGGPASGQNTDVFFSSTGSRAKKVSNTTQGYGFEVNATGRDMSAEVVCIRWAVTAGVNLLATRTAGGVAIVVQDTSGNQSFWDLDGNDTYGGGWKVSVADLSTTRSRNNGTDANLTVIQHVGIVFILTGGVGGGDPNTYIDQILSWPTAGVTVTGDSTAFVDDLVDVLDTSQGVWERRSGVVFSKARLILSPGASDFAETDRMLVFENPVYDAGATIDSALAEIGIESADTDALTFTRCSFVSADPDETVTTDANREFDFTSATLVTMETCQITGFDGTVVHLGANTNTYNDCTFQRLSQIVDTGASVRRGFVRDTAGAATESALLWTTSSDWEDTEFVMGAGNSHAMEVETVGLTDNWTGFTFTGYNGTAGPTTVGDEVLNNNSASGTVTINAADVTGVISFYNRGGAATQINSNVAVTFDQMQDNTEVRVYAAGTKNELDGIEDATAGSPGNRNFVASIPASTSVDYTMVNLLYEIVRVESFTWPGSAQTVIIAQRLDRNYENP